MKMKVFNESCFPKTIGGQFLEYPLISRFVAVKPLHLVFDRAGDLALCGKDFDRRFLPESSISALCRMAFQMRTLVDSSSSFAEGSCREHGGRTLHYRSGRKLSGKKPCVV